MQDQYVWHKWKEEPLTVQDFVLSHPIRVPVTTEADNHQPFVLAHNSLIDMPASDEMRKDDGAMAVIRPIKVWFGVEEGSVQWASVRASKELFCYLNLTGRRTRNVSLAE